MPFDGTILRRNSGGAGAPLRSTHLFGLEPLGAMRAPDLDANGWLQAAVMTSNGLQTQLEIGAGATNPTAMAHAVCWSWPIPVDADGVALAGGILNLADRLLILSAFERAVDATLPLNLGWGVGFCVGASPAGAGSGFAIGIESKDGAAPTERDVVAWRKATGTWTRTSDDTGDAAIAGVEWVPNRHSIASIANNKVNPLGTDLRKVAGLNVVDVSTTIGSVDVIDRVFAFVYPTSQLLVAPVVTFDFELLIFPDASIRHE
jgi:hypothetical protein